MKLAQACWKKNIALPTLGHTFPIGKDVRYNEGGSGFHCRTLPWILGTSWNKHGHSTNVSMPDVPFCLPRTIWYAAPAGLARRELLSLFWRPWPAGTTGGKSPDVQGSEGSGG